jgi:hypothetical protein
MRTTVRLNEELLKEAKRQAAESGMTLQAIIEESLRERLSRGHGPQQAQRPLRLKTTGSGGVLPGVNLDDSSSLLDAMEEGG